MKETYQETGRLFPAVKSRAQAIEKAEADLVNAPYFYAGETTELKALAVKFVMREIDNLRVAEPYHWEPDIVKIVVKGGATIPSDVPFHRCWLNGKAGWWWLGENTGLYGQSSVEKRHETREINALLWAWDEATARLRLMPFTVLHHEATGGPVPLGTVYWDEGLTLDQTLAAQLQATQPGLRHPLLMDESDWAINAKAALKLFACGSLWLQQKVIVTERTRVPKALGKKLKRQRLEPTVNVVQLRRREYVPTGEKKNVDWQCRWMVGAIDGGFWRNQKTAEGHKLIWVMPFVKGPADKPLKMPGERIFHVNR